jgi:hypothetical protein
MVPPSGSWIQSAEDDKPKYAGEEQRQAWIKDNGPEDLFVERKMGKDAAGNGGENDAHEKADEPRREKRAKNIECGCAPASRDCGREQCNEQDE